MALLPQPYLMDPSKTVEQVRLRAVQCHAALALPAAKSLSLCELQAVKEAVAAIGEKISVRRFVKMQLGEGIEKKESNLAADVAAMAGKA
jgi:translation elongation factor EF-Ts